MIDVQRTPGEAVPPLATARFTTTVAELSLHPPPVDLRVKLVGSAPAGSLYLQPVDACAFPILHEWVEPWAPLRIEFGSRNVMRADFDPLPAPWSTRFAGVRIDMLTLRADGRAALTLTGPHADLAAFSRRSAFPMLIEHVGNIPRDLPLLTAAQDSALRMAVAAGYYRIPRPVNLHQLAARLGISAASLSERLRRAEGRVIARYVALGAATPLDARTIFAGEHDLRDVHHLEHTPDAVQP